VSGQGVDVAQQILNASGFQKTLSVPVDSTEPSGQVIGTDPAAAQTVPLDTVIQLQVSRGNQFVMPDLKGQFWTDAEPNLRALGWTGVLIKGPNVDNSGVRSNGVVTQSPPGGQRRELRGVDLAQLRVVGGLTPRSRAETVSATSCSSRLTSASAGAGPQ